MTSTITTSVLSLLAYLLPIIIDGIRGYRERQQGANHEANVQEYRKALREGDSAALGLYHADQHDRVLAALRRG